MLNVKISNDQWLHASLPVRNGELRIKSAEMLAPSTFLTSAAFTLQLQNAILPASVRVLKDVDKAEAFLSWIKRSQTEGPPELLRVMQKV